IRDDVDLAPLQPDIIDGDDAGVEGGQVYIVSDFLEGPDLGQWLERHRPSWPEAARIAAAVADTEPK
ncbi:MAG TPA: hypothetical protein VNW94_02865, partial [Streptosporangiaceae bacterium]|nr:hypothetical protein [Streptosporangiaceae bacterium]